MREITQQEFDAVLTERPTPMVLDIWATWCGPCQYMAPLLEELSTAYEGLIRFVKSDVDKNPDLAKRFNVMSIPTLLIFADGEVVSTIVGAAGPDFIITELEKVLSAESYEDE
jgi:thioredoxin 1